MTAALFRHVTKCPTALVMDSVSTLMFVSATKEGRGKIVHSTHAHIWTIAQVGRRADNVNDVRIFST